MDTRIARAFRLILQGDSSQGQPWRTFTALAAARHYLLKNAGWDVEATGIIRRTRN